MKKAFLLLLWLVLPTLTFAANTVETVSYVHSNRTLTTPVDLVITATSNCIYKCTVDISCEDAAIIFQNVKPSEVIKNYLSNVTINGNAAVRYQNCRVSIYRHGSILLPFGKAYHALTVFSEADFAGESKTFTQGDVQNNLGEWDNRIQSFKLKRGYMVTFANHTDGTGYSHCYIADKEDLNINLPKEMAGRVSMLRVFHWQWPAKKGVCDLNGETERAAMNASWFYTWGAGDNSRTDAEAVPMRHHETGSYYPGGTTTDQWAWPGFDEINSRDETVTHVLGNNEPDNTGSGEVYKTPEELIEIHKEYLASGMRIGTFACCNPNTDWVNRYLTLVREQNMRCDFVATHYYIGGQSPENVINALRNLHTISGLPVWCTEWNNGANWTGESAFYTDSEGWYSWGNGEDSRKNGVFITDVLKRADNEKWLERMSVFSNVESKRMLWENGAITPAGQMYADYQSDFAYDSSNEYFMKWNYSNPEELTIKYDKVKQTATLKWHNPNSDLTNASLVQMQEGSDWVTLDTLALSDAEDLTYVIDVKGWEPGLYSFRVRNHDADGSKRRTTNEVGLTIAQANQVGAVQYGNLSIQTEDAIQTDFAAYDETPIVVTGMMSNANTSNAFTNNLKETTVSNFTFRLNPWQFKTAASITKAENVDFLIIPSGIYNISDNMKIIAGNVGSIKTTVSRVTFPEAFPQGVVPVVVCQNIISRASVSPTNVRITDVDNTGFSICLSRQEGETSTLSAQKVNYVAVSQGQADLGEGKMMTAYLDTSHPVGGTTPVQVPLYTDERQHFFNPFFIGFPQTNNYAKTSILRQSVLFSEDVDVSGETMKGYYQINVRRQTDASSTVTTADSATSNGDYVGWIIISDNPEGDTTMSPVIPMTTIESITQHPSPNTQHLYNLSGQRLTTPQKGINIIGGKKVIY